MNKQYDFKEWNSIRKFQNLKEEDKLKKNKFNSNILIKEFQENYQPQDEKVKVIFDNAKAKHKSKSKIEDWKQGKFASEVNFTDQMLDNPIFDSKIQQIDVDEFDDKKQSELQAEHVPFMIKNSNKQWVKKRWELPRLLHDVGHSKFKIGEDDNGKSLKVSLINFINYAIHNTDDSPLYIFNNKFDKRLIESDNNNNFTQFLKSKSLNVSMNKKQQARHLQNDFKVLKPFSKQDYFKQMKDSRPPQNWLLIGPERSGTKLHHDPTSTSAWNTLVVGHKLWFCIHPKQAMEIAAAKRYVQGAEIKDAIGQFAFQLPRMLLDQKIDTNHWQVFIQQPGETIFVPQHWWHAVLNLDDTLAYTQNLLTDYSFPDAIKNLQRSGKDRQRNLHKSLKNFFSSSLEKDKQGIILNYDDAQQRQSELNALEKFETIDAIIKKKQNGRIEKQEQQDSSSSDESSDESTDEFESEASQSQRDMQDDQEFEHILKQSSRDGGQE